MCNAVPSATLIKALARAAGCYLSICAASLQANLFGTFDSLTISHEREPFEDRVVIGSAGMVDNCQLHDSLWR